MTQRIKKNSEFRSKNSERILATNERELARINKREEEFRIQKTEEEKKREEELNVQRSTVLVQRELDKSLLQLRDKLAFGKRFFKELKGSNLFFCLIMSFFSL